MDWVTQGAIAIGVGLLVWYLTSKVEAVLREREKLQDDRRQIYAQVLEPYIRVFAASTNPSETKKALRQIASYDYRRASFELAMIGSDEVVRTLNDMMQYFYRFDAEDKSADPKTMVQYWGRVLLAIRRDLGNKKTKLSEIDMLRFQIKDIDKYFES